MGPALHLNNMNKNYDFTVKLKAVDIGSAVLVKQDEYYYLLTAAHVCENYTGEKPMVLTDIDGNEREVDNPEMAISPKEEWDVCVMKISKDVALAITGNVKCGTFEGFGYPCEIDGFPSNAIDKKLRIENKCYISQESEAGDELYIKLDEVQKEGVEMQYKESGFSGSGVFVDSKGEKYLIGIVHRVDEERSQFVGWKMQKINEVIKGKGWTEIPLIPIELRQQIINQYNKLIENTESVLKRIKNEIIGQIQLPRQGYRSKVADALETGNIVIITGEAGIGKSALAKEVLSDERYRSVAVLGDDLDEQEESDILAHWKITSKLPELFKSPIWGEGGKVLLVESAERMLNGNTDTAIVFVEDLLKNTPDLKIVFTIRKNALELFRISLIGNGIMVPEEQVIEIDLLDNKELMEVEETFPAIRPYIISDKTRHILRNPFYLNIACSIAIIADAVNLKESEFKDKLCRQIIGGKKHDVKLVNQRIEALIDVARRTSNVGMNLVKCEMTDVVKSLVDDDILVGQPELGLLRPGHDILTDWGLYCYIDDNYRRFESKEISLVQFYESLDTNIASRNMFRQYIGTHISEEEQGLDVFIAESLSLNLSDVFYDALFYAVLISDKGSSFLASIKDLLLRDHNKLLGKLSIALSYMFRKVDWNTKEFFEKRGLVDKSTKIRNSYYMLPSGKGWYTFVTFLYENRDVYYASRGNLIPLLLQCELVGFSEEEAPNLKKYVFSILADDVNQILSDERIDDKPDNNVIRLLFKWMNENPELIQLWAENTIQSNSYKYDVIKEFLLLSETLDAANFISKYPEIYKDLIRKEWLDDKGIVRDYYPMIHQSSGVTTTYKCFFYSHPADAIVFLCELLNEDIEKNKNNQNSQLEKIKVTVEGKQKILWGNDGLWRDYRGANYHSHVRESLLMTFEKWLMDCIKNNINKAKYALSKENLLAVFDIIYNKCVNVCAWGVLASVAIRFYDFVGLKAMPIYSCREFIFWDKTRLSSGSMRPFISPMASEAVKKEVIESYNLPHRKKDLEWVILTLSMTKEFAEEIRQLVKGFKESATTYLEKVSANRMDITQYKIIGEIDGGFVLQGSPSDDIKEEAEQTETVRNEFNHIIETANRSRKQYDDDSHNIADWREAYQLHKEQNGFIESKGLIAALGVKKFWDELDGKERAWCKDIIRDDTIKYVTSGQYQVDSEFSSDGLLFLIDNEPDDKELVQIIFYLIDSIMENDTIFERFENTYKNLIWGKHKELAKSIIIRYLTDDTNDREDADRFIQVCKFIPTDIEDRDIDEKVAVYSEKYFNRLTDNKANRYTRVSDMRMEVFCANYMLAMPLKRRKFIEDIWLASSKKMSAVLYDRHDNPIASVFNHYCYIATTSNKEDFWQLWELMFEWYQKNNTKGVLPVLMLGFDLNNPGLLENWEVMDGSDVYINKLLRILPSEGLPFMSRLICKVGFKYLMPNSLRYIKKDTLITAARDRRYIMLWQNAVEDLYDDAKTRDEIRRDNTLRAAYMEILNGLINNGSAIAYVIRDYYI